ncbi:MAG: peptidoglycan DD-metalloendopeptidase family protein [Bacillota bacterium]|jgi:murein DD-endopeptidase MepM/ murein hydrolase activator NlpD
MKKQKESFHQSVDDAIETLQKNNVGEDIPQKEESDSIIRKPNIQDNSESSQQISAQNTSAENQSEHRRANTAERKSAILKLTFMSILAVLVIGLAVVQDAHMPWNVERQLAELNEKAAATAVDKQKQPAQQQEAQTVAKNNTALPEKEQTKTNSPAAETAASPKTNAQTNVQTTASNLSWQLPASGKIIKSYGYSYDETWQDYRFHSGVDIALDKGKEVYAIADGTVTESGKTKALGKYIRIDYGSNLVGYYFGLNVSDSLTAGAAVSKNQALGTVTDPPLQESADPPHYHFALIQDGQTIDPAKLMK